MPKTKHNNDRSVSRHGTGQKAAKKGGGGGSELIMSQLLCCCSDSLTHIFPNFVFNYILITEGTWGKQGVTYENDAVADRFGPPVTRSQTSAAKK